MRGSRWLRHRICRSISNFVSSFQFISINLYLSGCAKKVMDYAVKMLIGPVPAGLLCRRRAQVRVDEGRCAARCAACRAVWCLLRRAAQVEVFGRWLDLLRLGAFAPFVLWRAQGRKRGFLGRGNSMKSVVLYSGEMPLRCLLLTGFQHELCLVSARTYKHRVNIQSSRLPRDASCIDIGVQDVCFRCDLYQLEALLLAKVYLVLA